MIKYLQLASSIAKKDKRDKHHKLGCVIVRKDGSVCGAYNSKVRTPSPSAHAECRALRKSGRGAITLYIVRIMADGSFGIARPCESCRRTIIKYKVKKVIYSINNSEFGTWYPSNDKSIF